MNQSQPLSHTLVRKSIGYGFTFNWLRKWCNLITAYSNAKAKQMCITFDTQVKTALTCTLFDNTNHLDYFLCIVIADYILCHPKNNMKLLLVHNDINHIYTGNDKLIVTFIVIP